MELLVFRHGPAEERDPRRWPDDDLRPLTPEGARESRLAARGVRRAGFAAALLVTSPAERARATAEAAREAWGMRGPAEPWTELAPGQDAGPVLARVAREEAAAALAVVGHEPTLGELVGLAITGDAVATVRLGRAGAALVSFPRSVAPGAGELRWLLTRKQLARLGR